MSIPNNIAALRMARGWSRPQLGKRMNTSGQQVERLEKGTRRLSHDWIDRAAAAFGVTAMDIIDPDGNDAAPIADLPSIVSTSATDSVVEIQSLDLSVSMGPGTVLDDFVESMPVFFDVGMLRGITRSPPHRLRMIRGVGDSMYPTLHDNDPIMIDTTVQQLTRQDAIYWISIHGASGIKRLRTIKDRRILIVSDNPAVENYEVDADDLRIEGRAIWYMRGI